MTPFLPALPVYRLRNSHTNHLWTLELCLENLRRTLPSDEPIFSQHIDWILANQEKQNIVFVSHVGDIVDKNNDDQWTVAQQCMNRLHGKVPYGISVGNHDMTSAGDSSLFQKYFPAERFADLDWYGGCFSPKTHGAEVSGNNANSFQLFSAAGIDFVFLHLECNAPDDVLAWADEVLQRHVDRCAIVTTHMGLGPLQHPQTPSDYMDAPKGRMQWKKIHGKRGNTPEQMWSKCFRKHPNLSMVCCGDQSRSHSLHEVAIGDHGNQVHQLLSDYSTGWLRLYRFHPAHNRVQACTFHPHNEVLCEGTKHVPEIAGHQFEFEVPFWRHDGGIQVVLTSVRTGLTAGVACRQARNTLGVRATAILPR